MHIQHQHKQDNTGIHRVVSLLKEKGTQENEEGQGTAKAKCWPGYMLKGNGFCKDMMCSDATNLCKIS